MISLLVLCLLASTGHAGGTGPDDRELLRLCSLMTGSFSSEAQAKHDNYFAHIVLHTRRIWTERKDACWLYVEQAEADKPQNPYRQRIYKLFRDGRGLTSKVFEIKQPTRLIGAWRDSFDLSFLTSADISDRPGCELFLKKIGNAFVGSTEGKKCISNLRGASYATSEAEITDGRIVTWDRGWNDKDEQVWGSARGGYIFHKISKDKNGQ